MVITEKATPGEIRMNIDSTTMKIFSEMDMPHGYHQIPLAEESKNKCIFQTHEGLHRMERLFFGPTSSRAYFIMRWRKP